MIVEGTTYLLTRNVVARHLLLRPDAAMTHFFLYALAVSAKTHQILVHAFGVMSSHIHLVVTDTLGKLPDFLAMFHRILALGTQRIRKWEGQVWDSRPTSVVRLVTLQAVVEAIAYVMTNPVAAGLVDRAHQWPGAKVDLGQLGTAVLQVQRPNVYFKQKSKRWPAVATLHLSLPPGIDDAPAFQEKVGLHLRLQEAEAHKHLKASRRTVLGVEGVLKTSPLHRAKSRRAKNRKPKGKVNPTFAVGYASGDAYVRAVNTLKAFYSKYTEALARWRDKKYCTLFPKGTWKMRVCYNALVEETLPILVETTMPDAIAGLCRLGKPAAALEAE